MTGPTRPTLPPAYGLTDPDFWRALLPGLSFTDDRAYPHTVLHAPPLTDPSALRADVLEHGYHVGASAAPHVGALAAAVRELSRRGLSPMWLLLADEVWLLTRAFESVYSAAFPGLRLLTDHYVFLVDPADPAMRRGWSPHRDRVDMGFTGPERLPEYVTVWIALTEATAENGCMYLLPAPDDPVYATDDPSRLPQDPQSALAVPVAAGTPIFWTGRVIHWGGRTAPRCPADAIRASLAFAAARPDYETGLFEIADQTRLPTLEMRLELVFERLENYQHRLASFAEFEALRAEHRALSRPAAPASDPMRI